LSNETTRRLWARGGGEVPQDAFNVSEGGARQAAEINLAAAKDQLVQASRNAGQAEIFAKREVQLRSIRMR